MNTRGLVRRGLLTALVATMALGFAGEALRAQSNDGVEDCIDDCIETYEDDMLVCQDSLVTCINQVALETQQCQDQAQNQLEEILCIRAGRIKRANCDRQYRNCENLATTVLYNCYRACVSSPSAP